MSWSIIAERVALPILFAQRTVWVTTLTSVSVPVFLILLVFAPSSGPRFVRWYIHTCGGGFVKVGQILAMRYDLLSPAYCEELSKLLDEVAPTNTRRIIKVIERELGSPLSRHFDEFEEEAIATASVAQVHGATLSDGRRVVLKVVRPGVWNLYRVDLAYLRVIGRLGDRYGPFSKVSLGRVVDEVIQLTREEFDFRREARNIDEMHGLMLSDEVDHYAPKVIPPLCTRSVITMERIEGVSVKEMIAAVGAGDQAQLDRWAQLGIEPKATAQLVLRSILEQTLRHRMFQADPHAANLIVMNGGTLAWVDFGMLGWLDEKLWKHQFKQRVAVAAGRIHDAYLSLLATLEPISEGDLSGFEVEVKGLFRDWMVASGSPLANISERSSGFFFLRMMSALRRAGLRLPAGLVRLYRTIIVGDIVMLKLDPEIDWVDVLRDFVSKEERRQLVSLLEQGFSQQSRYASAQAWADAPMVAVEVSDWLRYRLPEYSRFYRASLSRWERLAAASVAYARLAFVVALVAIVGSQLVAPVFFPTGGWAALGDIIQPYWGWLTVVGVVHVLLLGKLMRELDST